MLNYHLYKPNPFEGSPLSPIRSQMIKLKSDAFNATFGGKPDAEYFENIPIPKTLHRHCVNPSRNWMNQTAAGKITGLKIQAKGRRGSRSRTFTVGHGSLRAGDIANSPLDFAKSDFVTKMGATGIKVSVGYS